MNVEEKFEKFLPKKYHWETKFQEDLEDRTFIYKVLFNVEGKYLPATWDYPGEEPELEILEIFPVSYINENGEEILIANTERQFFPAPVLTEAEIEVLCWNYLENLGNSHE